MKTRHILLGVLIGLMFGSTTFAQQTERQIQLKLTNPVTKTTQTYSVNSVSYSCSKSDYASKKNTVESCSLTMDLAQSMDAFSLKWLSGEINELDGTIILEDTSPGKMGRTISFKNGKIGMASESFVKSDSSSYGQLSIYVKTLVIDGVSIYTAE